MFENGKSDGEVVVYFNVREAEKGIQDRVQLMHRFLDTCTSCHGVGQAGSGPAGRRIAKRVFTREGEEIFDVQEMEYDQEIWLSYGEDFKPHYGEMSMHASAPMSKGMLRGVEL